MSQPPGPGRALMALGVFPCSLVCVKEREREREGGGGGRVRRPAYWLFRYQMFDSSCGDDCKNSIIFLSN